MVYISYSSNTMRTLRYTILIDEEQVNEIK